MAALAQFPRAPCIGPSRGTRTSSVGTPRRVPRAARSRAERIAAKASEQHAMAKSFEAVRPSAAVLLSVAVATIGGSFSFGFHLGVMNGPLEAIAAELGLAAGDVTAKGFLVSASLIGAALGAVSGGPLADACGRRRVLALAAVPLLVGSVWCATACGFGTMAMARLVAGAGVGVVSACVPLFISEVAPTALRGALGGANQVMIGAGILAALLANVALGPAMWRWTFALAALPAALLLLGATGGLVTESPRWLAANGRTAEARKAAAALWGAAAESESTAGDKPTSGEGSGWGELFSRRHRAPVLAGVALFALQQLSGINAIIYFSSDVFRSAGVGSAALASAFVGFVNVAGSTAAMGAIEKYGRKALLTVSFAGMGVAMAVLSCSMATNILPPSMAAAVAVTGTVVYILAFGVGVGPVPALLVPEMNAEAVRSKAGSAAMLSHWAFNIVVGQYFLPAAAAVGVGGVYAFFALVCALGIAFVRTSVPETTGRSLESLEASSAV